ncbi:aminopeptidase [Chondrinema litorale]|uniref:aminopeptidase n=1 Tax=Chondrinema litorale TaxID=2994555 RepID=UPI002542E13B|nr:aminopeptidase [Chondrinema litorale]UZR92350.1 aminopeptidase [Chondrinema litorale]
MFLVHLFYRYFLWLIGWKIKGKKPKEVKKYVLILAHHTSNWDFPIAVAARPLVKVNDARFLGKASLFKSKFGFIFYWLGGTPVDRSKHNNLVDQVAEKYKGHEKYAITVTPEGTRSYVDKWKTGFYYMAKAANVPVLMAFIDYKNREIGVLPEPIHLTDDVDADLKRIMDFYTTKIPRYPENSLTFHGKGIKPPKTYNIFKVILKLLLTFIIVFSLINFELVVYGVKQAYGQLNIIFNAKPVTEFLEDPQYPEESKSKIELIQEIRQYAFDSLGLDYSNSYTKMYDQHDKPILWVVTACKPFKLENKEWSFPLLGTFSYKGYFDKKAIDKAEKQLDKEGWDVRVREVNGWSTLGILNDPILSNMLNRSEGDLAELIIHELTHGTLFIKDNLQYNENLANFVGEEGAKKFLISKYGEYSAEYISYINKQPDYKLFTNYILSSTKRLDSLYNSFAEQDTYEEKALKKSELISEITTDMRNLPFRNQRYKEYFDNFTPNNAFFMAFVRYSGSQNQFREEFEEKFNSNFQKYLSYLKETYPSMF